MAWSWPWAKRTEPERGLEQRAITWWDFGLDPSDFVGVSGERVTTHTALGLSAVWEAVGLISGDISQLPVDAVLVEGDQRIPVPPEARPRWLDDPGDGLTRIDVLGMIVISLLLRGDAMIITPRSENGEVMGLIPVDPDGVVISPEGRYDLLGEDVTDSIVHVRGLMWPGLPGQRQLRRGMSPITYAREVFGNALAAQKFGSSFFGKGGWVGGIMEIPGELSEEGQKAEKRQWDDDHRGAENAHKVAVAAAGAKFHQMTISPEDAQYIEGKQFNVRDVARMFFLDPSMLGESSGDSLTYSTLEGRGTHYTKFSLMRWIVRIELALTLLWRSEGGPSNGEIKLNVAALLRGSQKERYDNYKTALDGGWVTVDEVRALEDMPPMEAA